MSALAYPAFAARVAPPRPRGRGAPSSDLVVVVEIRAEASSSSSSSALDVLQGARIVAPNGGGDGEVRDSVVKYYGETLTTSDDLKTSACCTPNALPSRVRDILSKVPDEVKAKYYDCGSPTPLGIDGLRVLVLGSGSGRDCYVAAALVGEKGSVAGVDMTDRSSTSPGDTSTTTASTRWATPSQTCVSSRARSRTSATLASRIDPSTSSSPTAW